MALAPQAPEANAAPALPRFPRQIATAAGLPLPDPFTGALYGDTPIDEVPSAWVDCQIDAGKLRVVSA